jgi:hypothetical protein
MDCDHRLSLCSVAHATKGIFSITALDGVFEMVPDQTAALESLKTQSVGNQL